MKLQRWRRNNDISKCACCKTCDPKGQLRCTRCNVVKPEQQFDSIKLERWKKNRDLAKHAECLACGSARGATTAEPRRVWKQATYTCSQCKSPHAPGQYNLKTLAALEAEGQLYLAVCTGCEAQGKAGAPVTCVACGQRKPRNEFSAARLRHNHPETMRCLTSDFPACQRCSAKPDTPKPAPYTCESCLYPACKCGKARPRKTNYKVTVLPVWTCATCRQK